MANAEFEGGRGAHGQADEVRFGKAETLEDGGGVVGRARLRIGMGRGWNIGRRPTARRIANAAIAARKVAQLRFPAQMVTTKLVQEQDRITRACFFVVEAHIIVRRDPWHAASLFADVGAIAICCPLRTAWPCRSGAGKHRRLAAPRDQTAGTAEAPAAAPGVVTRPGVVPSVRRAAYPCARVGGLRKTMQAPPALRSCVHRASAFAREASETRTMYLAAPR